LKTKKNGKIGGKQKNKFRTNIIKGKKEFIAFRKKRGKKTRKNLLSLKKQKKGKQNNKKETKTRILLLELIITKKKIL